MPCVLHAHVWPDHMFMSVQFDNLELELERCRVHLLFDSMCSCSRRDLLHHRPRPVCIPLCCKTMATVDFR